MLRKNVEDERAVDRCAREERQPGGRQQQPGGQRVTFGRAS
jgi:hypothetical protein